MPENGKEIKKIMNLNKVVESRKVIQDMSHNAKPVIQSRNNVHEEKAFNAGPMLQSRNRQNTMKLVKKE